MPTSLLDLFYAPYTAGPVTGCGCPVPEDGAVPDEAFLRHYHGLLPALRTRIYNIGVIRALQLAAGELYGADLFREEDALQMHHAVQQQYSDYSSWYRRVMQASNTERGIKPVHPEYLRRAAAGFEAEYTLPIMRIDSLLGQVSGDRLDVACIEHAMHTTIRSLDDCLDAIDRFFELMQGRAVGIKQVQAYFRTLAVSRPSHAQAAAAFAAARTHGDRAACLLVQDYLHRRILQHADERGLPYQIHTGMTNLGGSDPSHLEPLLREYPQIQFVLLHCHPYVEEATYLARIYPNCSVDLAWLALQGRTILEKALQLYLSMVPADRIHLSADATFLEEYYGAMCITRTGLSHVLEEITANGEMTAEQALFTAERLLRGNSRELYHL